MQYLDRFRRNIVLLVLISLLASMGLVSLLSLQAVSAVVADSAEQAVTLLCREEASVVTGEFSHVSSSVDLLDTYLEQGLVTIDGPGPALEDFLEELSSMAIGAVGSAPSVSAVYVRMDTPSLGEGVGFLMLREGDSFRRTPLTDITRFDPDDTENVGWYYLPKNSGEAMWMPPYTDYRQQILMTSYIVPVTLGGEAVGVLGMDISLEYLNALLDRQNVYEGGYGYLVYQGGEPLLGREDRQGERGWTTAGADCTADFTLYETAPNGSITRGLDALKLRLAVALLAVTAAALVITVWSTLEMNRVLARTLREAYDNQQAALDAAERASRAKSEFLARMSHDIRTPLNAIVGMTAIGESHPEDREKLLDCLEKIRASGRQLLTLVNDILDISKADRGELTLSPVQFSLRGCIEDLTEIAGADAREKGLTLTVETGELPCDTVTGDRVRVNQIFQNLLSNAVKYTPAPGSVTLRLEERFSEETGLAHLTCTVSDTGVGMAPEFMETMYDSFSRETDTRVNRVRGSGLGLTVVKQLVDLMGGTIRCESREGEGTAFTVELDLPGEPGQSGGGDSLAGLHLLVAEDNELNWEVISELLELCEITCERACDGRECLERLTASPPGTFDLVLMDVQMPVMNGREAARAIRAQQRPDLAGLPIIALSADAFTEDIAACLESGMNSHVAKPVDLGTLLQELRKALGRSGAPSPREPAPRQEQGQEQEETQEQGEGDLESRTLLRYFLETYTSAYTVNLRDRTFEILHMAHAFQQVFTMDGSMEDMARFVEEHVHPEDRPLMRQMTDPDYVRSRMAEQRELSFTLREQYDGAERTMHAVIIRSVDADHVVIGFLDVSAEVQREREINERLEAANHAKRDFLSAMSHDIRTPMNAILGMVDIALNSADDREKVLDCLQKISVSGRQLISLVNDILDISAIESGRAELRLSPYSVEEGAELLRNTRLGIQNGKQLEFRLDQHDILYPWILADEVRVNQVTHNLLSNAIKYTPEGGSVTLENYQERDAEGKTWSVIIVSDTGIGMSPEFLERMWDTFSRATDTRINKIQGTGLGLSIVKGLVELMGGTITAESELNRGSRFTVRLPILPAPPEDIPRGRSAVSGDSLDLHILVAEDNEMNWEIAGELLELKGASCTRAENGQRAVELFTQSAPGTFDAILMDMQMPVMDGLEATRAIRASQHPEARTIPILAMTANAFTEDVEQCLAAGMNDHLSKPIEIEKVAAALRACLQG